jgi:iron complex outermembrane receptor protein
MDTYGNGDTEIDLESEYLNSFQLTLAGDNWVDGLSLELNGFYNRATNLIYTSILKHANAGTIKTIGVEFIGNYKLNSIFSNLTVSWQRVLESEIYERKINDAYNIPKLTINAVLGVNVTKKLVLHGHLGIESSQTCFMVDLEKRNIIESKLNGRALLDLGARYKFNNMFELGMNGHNVLNHQYYRGGLGSGQIHQPGRSVMAYLALKF